MRLPVTALVLLAGVVLAAVSYIFLAAPLGGSPFDEGFSNPRMDFAPTLFVIGVALSFVAAMVYEILPKLGDE